MIRGLSAETERDLILSVGTHRGARRLSPMEVAEAFETATESGETVPGLASKVQLDSTMITRFRQLLRLSKDVQYLVDWGGKSYLPFASASHIARLKSDSDQHEIAEAALKYRLSKEEIRQVIQIRERSNKAIHECIEEILKMRPQIVQKYLFLGAVISSATQGILRGLRQAECDQLLKNAINSCFPDLPTWEGRLTTERFTIIGDKALDLAIRSIPGGFEQAINDCIEIQVTKDI